MQLLDYKILGYVFVFKTISFITFHCRVIASAEISKRSGMETCRALHYLQVKVELVFFFFNVK